MIAVIMNMTIYVLCNSYSHPGLDFYLPAGTLSIITGIGIVLIALNM
jgi:hypothetical protein